MPPISIFGLLGMLGAIIYAVGDVFLRVLALLPVYNTHNHSRYYNRFHRISY